MAGFRGASRMSLVLRRLAAEFGALRLILAALVLLVSAAVPFSDGPAAYSGWRLATTVVAPTVFVMLVFVLPLDMIMSAVFMSGGNAAARARFRRIILAELALLAAMALAWMPFVLRLLNPPSG